MKTSKEERVGIDQQYMHENYTYDGETITVGRFKDFDEACAAKTSAMRSMGIAV